MSRLVAALARALDEQHIAYGLAIGRAVEWTLGGGRHLFEFLLGDHIRALCVGEFGQVGRIVGPEAAGLHHGAEGGARDRAAFGGKIDLEASGCAVGACHRGVRQYRDVVVCQHLGDQLRDSGVFRLRIRTLLRDASMQSARHASELSGLLHQGDVVSRACRFECCGQAGPAAADHQDTPMYGLFLAGVGERYAALPRSPSGYSLQPSPGWFRASLPRRGGSR